jgi:adenylate kinase
MKLVIMGPPGTGKGTQAKLLAKKYRLISFSVGQLLRKEAKSKTKRGKSIAEILKKGNLVSDKVVLSIIKEKLRKRKDNFIFDGFPRDRKQIRGLNTHFDCIIQINSSKKNILDRLRKRGRDDDNLKVIEHRFDVYRKKTLPVLEYFRKKKVSIISVNGNQSIAGVHREIVRKLNAKIQIH